MIAIGSDNYLDTATIDGTAGDWVVSLPPANAGTLDYEEVARSTDADPASTVFDVELDSAVPIRGLRLEGHNFSPDGLIRLDLGTTAGDDNLASLEVPAWAFTPRVFNGRDWGCELVLPAAISAMLARVQITDPTNPDGYVEFARAYLGPLFVPQYNASYGLKDSKVTSSTKERSIGMNLWRTKGRVIRTCSFIFEALSLEEGSTLHAMQHFVDTVGEIWLCRDLSDRAEAQQFGFLGTLDELAQLDYPRYRGRGLGVRATQT